MTRRRVLVVGAKGRVGSCIVEGVRAAEDLELAGAIDLGGDLAATIVSERPQVAVDFTLPDAVYGNLEVLLAAGVHAVVGTTGLSEKQLQRVDAMAREHRVSCLVAPNFALGAVLMMRFSAEAARHFPWAEIVERHHEKKLDAPSGTARMTAERMAQARPSTPSEVEEVEEVAEIESSPGARGGRVDGIPVHSLRLPGSLAHQEVWFGGPGETLVIRHDALSREVYVPGVLLAVRRIGERPGLLRGLEHLLWPEG